MHPDTTCTHTSPASDEPPWPRLETARPWPGLNCGAMYIICHSARWRWLQWYVDISLGAPRVFHPPEPGAFRSLSHSLPGADSQPGAETGGDFGELVFTMMNTRLAVLRGRRFYMSMMVAFLFGAVHTCERAGVWARADTLYAISALVWDPGGGAGGAGGCVWMHAQPPGSPP